MNRKKLLVSVALLLLALGGFYGVYYYLSTTPLSVDFTSVNKVDVVEKKSHTKIGTLSQSSETIRLKKNTNYELVYLGKTGYSNGSMAIKSSDTMPVVPKPYYSEKKLASLLDSQREQINTVVNEFLSTGSTLYSIKQIHLYHYGDWCGVKLTYNGEYSSQSDDIRLVLQKKSNLWTPVTAATILLSMPDYPTVPFDILDSINKL